MTTLIPKRSASSGGRRTLSQSKGTYGRRSSGGAGTRELEGRSTQFGFDESDAVRIAEANIRAAELLKAQGVENSDGFLDRVMSGAAMFLQTTGLDFALQNIDRVRKTAITGIKDISGIDEEYGYEFSAADYRSLLVGGGTLEIEERMKEEFGTSPEAVDALLGVNRDLSASSLFENLGWEADLADDLPTWLRVPANITRFTGALGVDMLLDPISYFTGGFGGLGRATATKVIQPVIRGIAANTVDDLIRQKTRTAALRFIEQEVKKGTYSRLQANAARETVENAAELMGKNTPFDEAILKGAGFTGDFPAGFPKPGKVQKFFQSPDRLEPGGNKGTLLADSVFGRRTEEVLRVIETKRFDADNPAWREWVEYVEGGYDAKNLMWTAGGLRFGLFLAPKRTIAIPGVTKATRGVVRRGVQIVKETELGERAVRSNLSRKIQPKWLKLRTLGSKEKIQQIRAIRGGSIVDLVESHTNAPVYGLRAILEKFDIPDNPTLQIESGMTGIRVALVKELDEAQADVIMAQIRREIGSGIDPGRIMKTGETVLKRKRSAIPGVSKKINAQIDIVADVYDELDRKFGEMLSMFPDLEDIMSLNTVHRRLLFTDEFQKEMSDLVNINEFRSKIPDWRTSEGVADVARQTGRSVEDIELFRENFESFGTRSTSKKAYGEASSLRLRSIGRGIIILDDGFATSFNSLEALDESLAKTYIAIAKLVDMPTTRMSKALKEGKATAIHLNPGDQMNSYSNQVLEVVQNQLVAGEAFRRNILSWSTDELRRDLVASHLQEIGVWDDLADLMKGSEALEVDQVRRVILDIGEDVIEFENGLSKLKVHPALMNDPMFAQVVEDLQKVWDNMIRANDQVIPLFRREVVKFSKEFPELSEAQVQSMALDSLLTGLKDAETQYLSDMHSIIRHEASRMIDILDAAGIRGDELMDLTDTYLYDLKASAARTIEAYRSDYVKNFVPDIDTVDLPAMSINAALDNPEFGRFIRSLADADSERAVAAAGRTAARYEQQVERVVAAGGNDFDIRMAQYRADFARAEEIALTAALEGRGMPTHSVTLMVVTDMQGMDELIESLRGFGVEIRPQAHTAANLADRQIAFEASDMGLFFFDTQWAGEADRTFQLIRWATDGTPVNRKIKDYQRDVLDWWDNNMMQVVEGLWVPKRESTQRPPFLVVSHLPQPQQANDLINMLQMQFREGQVENLFVDFPTVYGANVEFPLSRTMTLDELVKTKWANQTMPGVSIGEKKRMIVQANEGIFQPRVTSLDYSEGRVTETVVGGGATPKGGKVIRFDVEGRRKKPTVVGHRASKTVLDDDTRRAAELFGLSWDDAEQEWMYVPGASPKLEELFPIMKLGDRQLDELSDMFPSSLADLSDPRYGWLDELAPSLRQLSDEGDVEFVTAGRVEALDDAVRQQLRLVGVDDEAVLDDILTAYRERLTESVETFDVDIPTGLPDVSPPDRFADEATFGIETNLGDVLRRMQQEQIEQMRRGLPLYEPWDKTVDTYQYVISAGTRIRAPHRQLRWTRPVGTAPEKLPFGAYDVDPKRLLPPIPGTRYTKASLEGKYKAWFRGEGDETLGLPTVDEAWFESQAAAARTETAQRPWFNAETRIVITRDRDLKPSGAINIGRGDGTIRNRGFGNPYLTSDVAESNWYKKRSKALGNRPDAEFTVVSNVDDAVEKYQVELWERIDADPEFAGKVAALSGKELWYWRPDGRTGAVSHADVLADAADFLAAQKRSLEVSGEVLELSTRGDAFGKQFSALNARIKGRGNRTIEDIYQTDIKGYKTRAEGKGKPPKDTSLDLEVEYRILWDEWVDENPELFNELVQRVTDGAQLTDQFAREGTVSQARTLNEIAQELIDLEATPTAARNPRDIPLSDLPKHRPLTTPPPEGASVDDMIAWKAADDAEAMSLYRDGDVFNVRDADFEPTFQTRSKYVDDPENLGAPRGILDEQEQLSDAGRYAARLTEGFVPELQAMGSVLERDVIDFVSSMLTRIVSRSERSIPDYLSDVHRFLVRDILMDGVITTQRRAMTKELGEVMARNGIDPGNIRRQVRAIRMGHIEAVKDPQMKKYLAIGELDRRGVTITPDTIFEEIERQEQILLNRFAQYEEVLNDATQSLIGTKAAADPDKLIDIVQQSRTVGTEGPATQRIADIDAFKELYVDSRDELQAVVSRIFGSEYQIGIAAKGDGGIPVIFIDTPRADRSILAEKYGGAFDEALDALTAGDITRGDAYRWGIPQLVAAADARRELDNVLLQTPHFKGDAAKAARAESMHKLFTSIVTETQKAIDTGDAGKLRALTITRTASGAFSPKPQFVDILDALKPYPEHAEFLRRYIESGYVAGLKDAWISDEAFAAWWQTQRHTQASLEWSLNANVNLLNRTLEKVADGSWSTFGPDDVNDLEFMYKNLSIQLAGIPEFARATMDHPVTGGRIPLMGDLATGTDAAASAARNMNFRAVAFDKDMVVTLERLINILDVMGDDTNAVSRVLNELSGRVKGVPGQKISPKQARALKKKIEDTLGESRFWIHVTDPEKVSVKTVGLDAGIFSERLGIDEAFVPFIETTFNNSQALFTPYATASVQTLLRRMENVWKAGATVARPAFHVRNFIGGVYNGFIAGVRPEDYWRTIQDVIIFRRQLKKLALDGVEDASVDVMDFVFGAVSEQNRKMFREAWDQKVIQTSFTRAEHLYDPKGGLSIKPYETNFVLFQKGGQTMEFVEDWLRMATFSRWFDEGATDLVASGATAKAIVHAVHFDYTDLTNVERSIKKIMPFYVWSRRNIPLQVRTLVQSPSHMLWYYRARSNWNEQQLQQMGDKDSFARQAAMYGFITPFTRNNDYGWSRLMMDPQLPMYDLDLFPWEEGPVGWFNPMWALSAITDQIGPGLSLPFTLSQQADEGGLSGTNARAGLNAVFASMDRIGLPTPEQGFAPTASIAPDVDYRVSKWFDRILSTTVPYYDDWRAFLGVKPNNPYRASGEGWLPGEDPGIDLVTRVMLGPLGRTIGRGGGVSWYTPQDAFFDAAEIRDELDRRRRQEQFQIGHPTDQGLPYDAEYTDEEIAAIINP